MIINQRIKAYLKSKGITIRFVANTSGINEKKLYQMLNSKARITTDDYGLICKALDIDEGYFYKENFIDTTNTA